MREYHVLNLGAGVQSTCLYLLSREPDSPLHFDLAIFADTGEEPGEVYRHLEYLKLLGEPAIWVRSSGKLGDDLVRGRNGRFVSIPAFTRDGNGKVGRVRRQCTREYKIEVVEKAIRRELLGLKPRQRMPGGVRIFQYFGITTDEAARAVRARKRFEGVKHTVPVYPFLDMGWSRKDCETWLEGRLPHRVPKSACVLCPFRTNQAWADLKAHDPEGWRRAVEIDNALRDKTSACTRGFRQALFLHRSCVPLEQIAFAALPPHTLNPMTTGECHGMCGV